MNSYNSENVLNSYFYDLKKLRLLTEDEEMELSLRVKDGDQNAKEIMIKSNLRFVVKIAKEYLNLGLSLSELISEGNIGLIIAVEKFDPLKGIRFANYSIWWIRQAIMKALSEKTKNIRLPQNRINDYKKIINAQKEYLDLYNNQATDEDLSAMLNIPVNDIRKIKSATSLPVSIYMNINDDNEKSMLIDTIDSGDMDILDNIERKEEINDIHKILDSIDKRESDVLKMRFGIDGYHCMSLEDIGEVMSLTKERIRQIEKNALVHFKEKYSKYYTNMAA